MKRCACVSILMLVVLLGACQREVPVPPAAAAEIPEPAPDAGFCAEEADGDYLNPNSCRSLVICRGQQIAELRICPKGEVINGLSEQRPLRCLPLAESDLNTDCSFKPVPLSDVLPE